MKKLLSGLLLAPLAITACGGGDSGSGGSGSGGAEDKGVKVFGYQFSSGEDVARLFTDGHDLNLKAQLDATATGSGVWGGAFSWGSTDVFTGTNIDGNAITKQSAPAAFGSFKTALGTMTAERGGTIPTAYANVLKAGQAKVTGSHLNENTDFDAANFEVKALGTAANTVVTLPSMSNFASKFTGNYMNALNAQITTGTSGAGTLWTNSNIVKIKYINTTGEKDMTQVTNPVTGVDLGGFKNIPTPTKWKSPVGTSYNTMLGSFNPKLTSQTTGSEPTESITTGTVTDSAAFMSYYVVDSSKMIGADSIDGGTLDINIGIFHPDGALAQDVATLTVQQFNSHGGSNSGGAMNTAAATAMGSLFGGLNTVAVPHSEFAVTTAGASEVDSGYAKGFGFLTSTDKWRYVRNDLTSTDKLNAVVRDFSFSDEMFKHWLDNSKITGFTKETKSVFTGKLDGNVAVDFNSSAELYKAACNAAKAAVEAAKQTFAPTCPA